MNLYGSHGFRDFIIACGYKGEIIKQYFDNFYLYNSDLKIDLRTGTKEITNSFAPDWNVNLVDTGISTHTGGRLLRLRSHIGKEPFLLTYGDGLSDVDIRKVVSFHRSHGKLATVTAVVPPPRFGSLELEGDRVAAFSEKPHMGDGWINGGFMVLQPEVLDYIPDEQEPLERTPMERLAAAQQLIAFRHSGFWHPMDTLRDKQYLESLWESGKAPWARLAHGTSA
jgi:glucose-1-phosphate cytidylyltransferase